MTETLNYKGFKIEIHPDEFAENPIQEWDMLGEFICWHRKYNLGNSDRFDTPDEVKTYAKNTRSILFNLYMYEHSGIALSLSNEEYPFNDQWDAGQLGYVLVDREKALKEYNVNILSLRIKQKVREVIKAEVEVYNQYLSGDVFLYIINNNGETIDSCGGNYGIENTIENAKTEIDGIIKHNIEKHCHKVKQWIRNQVPFVYRTHLCLP